MGLTDFELEEVDALPHFSLANSRNKAILVDGIDNLFCSLLVPGGIAAGKYAVHHDGRCHSSYSAVPIYHLFTNGRHLTKSLSCHDFFIRCRNKTTLGQKPNTKQSAIYKTKCNVLNCLLYTRAPDPHMHIQHMHNQYTHIFRPHVCQRL